MSGAPGRGVVLVAGGAGFIGSNLIRWLLEHTDLRVVNFDLLSYAGNLENLADIVDDPRYADRYAFVKGDIREREQVVAALREHRATHVVNCAAETHVDRSIYDATPFVRTNVLGAQVMLDAGRELGIERFLHVSTDEVYGDLESGGRADEESPIRASSPYSAAKAGADLLVAAYARTYGYKALLTRCSNNYGPYQFPEKLIPLMISNAIEGKKLPVYGDGRQVRDWLHVEDHAAALTAVLLEGEPGRIYNIAAENERPNLEVVKAILKATGRPESLLETVKDRPGHDRRYALSSHRIRAELGWKPRWDFEKGLAQTIAWYREHADWWQRIKSGDYQGYYEKHYGTGGLAASRG